jgi:hypothetical protein
MEIISIKDLDNKKVIGGGVIVYSRIEKEIHLLLGREAGQVPWPEMFLYSEFGGRIENENTLDGIIREFYEETQGFFGDFYELKERIEKEDRKLVYLEWNSSIYLFYEIEYCKNIEKYYRNNYLYYEKMVNDSNKMMHFYEKGYFEKDSIKYFSLDNKLKCLMRKHFAMIIPFLIENKEILF